MTDLSCVVSPLELHFRPTNSLYKKTTIIIIINHHHHHHHHYNHQHHHRHHHHHHLAQPFPLKMSTVKGNIWEHIYTFRSSPSFRRCAENQTVAIVVSLVKIYRKKINSVYPVPFSCLFIWRFHELWTLVISNSIGPEFSLWYHNRLRKSGAEMWRRLNKTKSTVSEINVNSAVVWVISVRDKKESTGFPFFISELKRLHRDYRLQTLANNHTRQPDQQKTGTVAWEKGNLWQTPSEDSDQPVQSFCTV